MREVAIGILIFAFSASTCAQESIRQVDWKNFTYPLSGPRLGHDRLEWLDTSKVGHLELVNGRGAPDSPGFTFKSVKFADVTSDGKEDAVVVVHLNTGGTQQTDYVYIYSFAPGKPRLLAYFHSGDRGTSGLHDVYGEDGKLVVELYDPKKRSGDCCSSGFVRTRYKWQNGRFETSGAREAVSLPEP